MHRLATWTITTAAAALFAAAPAIAAGEDRGPSPMGVPSADTPADPSVDAPPPADRPAQSPAMPTAEDSADYVVQKGDTLAEIAQSELGNAGKWQVIARANGIDDPQQLRVGQKLKIPKDEAAGAPPRPEL